MATAFFPVICQAIENKNYDFGLSACILQRIEAQAAGFIEGCQLPINCRAEWKGALERSKHPGETCADNPSLFSSASSRQASLESPVHGNHGP